MIVPRVSVVTAVHNGVCYLEHSIRSILRQDCTDLELIVVDDGSDDGSDDVLRGLAVEDSRIRLLQQENQGLTAALIRGCATARGEFIARHDPDDVSNTQRLSAQIRLLESDSLLSMASCWSSAIGPQDELLYEVRRPMSTAQATSDLVAFRAGPPGHGSAMVRRSAYERAGGYRPQFRYAQDWDLWFRLAEVGPVAYVPDFLYAFRIAPESLSVCRRRQQFRLARLAQRCRIARRSGRGEQSYLQQAARISATEASPRAPRNLAQGNYFIGRCLMERDDPRCHAYLRRCVQERPWHWKGWLALLHWSARSRSRHVPSAELSKLSESS